MYIDKLDKLVADCMALFILQWKNNWKDVTAYKYTDYTFNVIK